MLFSELTSVMTDARVTNHADATITGIAYDSRDVTPGDVFIAMAGGSYDSHGFIDAAIKSGAVAVMAERDTGIVPADVPYAVVPDGRRAMGEIAARFRGYPSRSLTLIGVTGTSGKTTVTHLIQAIFNAAGGNAGLIGTLGAQVGDTVLETKHTTPESVDIQRILREMADRGVKTVAMEASSHGLYQGRTLGCEFNCGVFTNIARDHLDYHETVEAYLDAKLILFRDYPARSSKAFHAVINADDPLAGAVCAATNGSIITFGIDSPADVVASNISVTEESVSFDMTYHAATVGIHIPIGGFFNVYNALAASAAALACGLDLDKISHALRNAPSVPGRFESIERGQDFGVVVDYAHTPDELENVLRTARELTNGRLIAVFGCGGDRDRGKRPIMGGIGAAMADAAVITSDNPRTEAPNAIIDDILQGVPKDALDRVTVRPDREEAIREALTSARAGDIVVIAGKGHEDYQIFADRTIHFDDREVAARILEKLKV
jgi:UDP-N-acetylmuramoyl-L-alanyl-D-glutamate--2,6-diaminopimelate ligase